MLDEHGTSGALLPRVDYSRAPTVHRRVSKVAGAASSSRAGVSLLLFNTLIGAVSIVSVAVAFSNADAPEAWIPAVSVLAFVPVAIGLVAVNPAYIWASWVLFCPIGYFFLTFPHERALFTFDRGLTALAFCTALLAQRPSRRTGELRGAALLWAAYVAVAGFSITFASDQMASFKVWFDSLLLPVFMGWAVRNSFDPKRHRELLVIVLSAMAISCATIGVAELLRGEDLLRLAGAGLYFTGSADNPILRANGPFLTNNSLALIGLVGLFFLQFLMSAGEPLRRGIRAWAWCGTVAFLVTALLPMFRSVLLTIAIVVLAELYWRRGRGSLVLWTAIAAFVAFIGSIVALNPDLARDRIWDFDNIAGRLVQYEQTWHLLQDRLWFGVGLDNFNQAALASPWAFNRNGVAALDYSHSNLGSAFAETGLVGGAFYAMAHLWLLRALLKRTRTNAVARRYGLRIFLAYWVSGLSLASGFYGDLNTWYMVSLAVVFCYAALPPSDRPTEVRSRQLSLNPTR